MYQQEQQGRIQVPTCNRPYGVNHSEKLIATFSDGTRCISAKLGVPLQFVNHNPHPADLQAQHEPKDPKALKYSIT